MSINFDSAITCAKWVLIAWFRLFVGDLSNDVSDDVLTNAFNKYTSFTKARVIRDRLSQKVSTMSFTTTQYIDVSITGQIRVCRFFRPRRLLEGLERDGW